MTKGVIGRRKSRFGRSRCIYAARCTTYRRGPWIRPYICVRKSISSQLSPVRQGPRHLEHRNVVCICQGGHLFPCHSIFGVHEFFKGLQTNMKRESGHQRSIKWLTFLSTQQPKKQRQARGGRQRQRWKKDFWISNILLVDKQVASSSSS